MVGRVVSCQYVALSGIYYTILGRFRAADSVTRRCKHYDVARLYPARGWLKLRYAVLEKRKVHDA